MVYGFFLIGSLLVGALYWIITNTDDETAKNLMWAPGSGLITPEPWLQDAGGGYTGWSPSANSVYAAWSPGAYLNIITPTISASVTRTTTSGPTRRTRTRRTRLPAELPADISDTVIPPAPSEEVLVGPIPPSITETSSETDVIPPSESEKASDDSKLPPGMGPSKLATKPPTTTEKPIDLYGYGDYRRIWKSKDENEEAYEENPHDLMNTRPPDKLPIEGWGYDYDNKP